VKSIGMLAVMLLGCTADAAADGPVVVSLPESVEFSPLSTEMAVARWNAAVGCTAFVLAREPGPVEARELPASHEVDWIAHGLGKMAGVSTSSDPASVMHEPPGSRVTPDDAAQVGWCM
jgi:hypothetical protein